MEEGPAFFFGEVWVLFSSIVGFLAVPTFKGGDIREFLADAEQGQATTETEGSKVRNSVELNFRGHRTPSLQRIHDSQLDDNKIAEIQDAISQGANSFLLTEYKSIATFCGGFSLMLIFLLSWGGGFTGPSVNNSLFTTVAFLMGAATSCVSGFMGMRIATFSNARTALEARKGVGPSYNVALRGGAVMGFSLASSGIFVLYATIRLFAVYYGTDLEGLFEAIAGYGLGGSAVALFGRVGGGIYTKAADVGADLVGKVEKGIPEDDPRNPAVIADNVGDNVGDIAGMGADLFGSFAEATCAALVLGALSPLSEFTTGPSRWETILFPLLISVVGLIVSLVTLILLSHLSPVKAIEEIEPSLKRQLIVSTALMTPAAYILALTMLPASIIIEATAGQQIKVSSFGVFICVAAGLWSGLLIGLVTEYYTSHSYSPVREVADASRTGAATNIIFGLSLGYKSCIIPVAAITVAVAASHNLAGMYGVALSALGMLSTLAIGLAIDAYGPIADNAGGIAEMAGMGQEIRLRTDALDAAGNTTAAIGKGFAIGSAALVSLSLFGAYVARVGLTSIDIMEPSSFSGLLIGAMLPYWFSALTVRSVGTAALAMVEEVRRQFQERPGLMEGTEKPDYRRCVSISTIASLREMIAPGALVLFTPPIFGILFGAKTLAGLLAGALVSGIQMAISASNTGGAWDNAKKYLESGATEHARSLGGKGSEAHKAAVTGDTVGDPLKDTSGPALNILIKLMAVESLVMAPVFTQVGSGLALAVFTR